MMKKFKFLLVVFFLTTLGASAQVKIGDNPTSLNSDAVLEMESADKGLLLPRVALTSTTAPDPLSAHVQGMTVYNKATAGDVTPGYYYNNGTKWVRLVDATSFANADVTKDAWVDDAANSVVKLGTKSDGTARSAGTEVVVTDDGKIGIGTTDPIVGLQINGNSGGTGDIALVGRSDWKPGDGLYCIGNIFGRNQSSNFFSTRIRLDGDDTSGLIVFYTSINSTRREQMRINPNGTVGIGTAYPKANLDVKGYIKVGSSDVNAAATPLPGMIRYNATNDRFEGYTANSGWVPLN